MQPTRRQKLKAFLLRRRINTLSLFALTLLSGLITLICAMTGHKRTGILFFVTAMLLLLCAVQSMKLRSSYRTLHAKFRRKKKKE